MEQIKEQLTDIKSMNMDELTEFIISLGEKKFRAKQIYEWIHVKHVESFDEMTNISKKFIQVLKDNAILISLKKEEVQVSKLDGTRKYLFALDDGNVIESVLYAYLRRLAAGWGADSVHPLLTVSSGGLGRLR